MQFANSCSITSTENEFIFDLSVQLDDKKIDPIEIAMTPNFAENLYETLGEAIRVFKNKKKSS